MTNYFYDQYSKKSKTAKELWDTLKSVYQAEEASTKKFLVSNYMDFKMTDERPISVQVRELQLIANDICAADSLMNLELVWFKELDKRYTMTLVVSMAKWLSKGNAQNSALQAEAKNPKIAAL
ncbi:hypothetical protein RJ639_007954 [Escallonia herrerae]|uniref:Uncharacterized protein n=1 Tax=Escallonia herrerae TaxID=1293975 RepID=A0AA88VV48_9ASTE|nr:hypothetical protein RJ639_007954 [Escallonia herrerae]